jgi:tetratricopeptide (TPR) repeat protein
MRIILSVIGTGLLAVATLHAEQNPAFSQANGDFAAGEFRKAIDGYEQLVRAGNWSANLFYDLGNAWYRGGDRGKAILNYERALALEPHHPEAEANLRLVRDQARALELRPSPIERSLSFATAKQYAIGAAITFWIVAFVAAASLFALRRSVKRTAILVVGVAVCVASTWAAYVTETGRRGDALAIVTADKVEARLATADTSASVLALPPGSEIKILSTRGNWIYAALPNEQHGWIPASAAELVRL